jgi:hypothetical protein
MASARFADVVVQAARNHGMILRFSFPPYPLLGRPREVLRRYVEGADPITGKPLMQEVVEALTAPLTEDEKHPEATPRAPRPRLMRPDTEDNLHRFFLENGWTDGLPVVLPTEERVRHMLMGTSADPSEVVGRMSVTHFEEKLEYTVEKVAVNAVMAGAGPEHLPVILALAATQEASMPSSTTSFARMAVVNGPIRHEIAMNAGLGALSPLNYANSVIGRAWTLMAINLADVRAGETFMASTGNNLNYNNMLMPENEERSPWLALHVQKGYRKEESVVSVFRGWSALNSMGAAGCCRPAHEEMAILLRSFAALHSAAAVVMDPLVAQHLKEQGFETPAQLAEWLSHNVQVPKKQYWEADLNYAFVHPQARRNIEPYASWAKLPDDALIAPYINAKAMNMVVVGGETQPLFFCTDFGYSQSQSIDRWRPKTGVYPEDEQARRRREARQKRHAAMLTASGYER